MQQHMQSFLSHFWNLWVRLLQSGILLAFLVIAWHRWSAHQKRRRHGTEKSSSSSTTSSKATRRSSIAFFHPHCSAGGGGERVLWKMVQVLGNLMERGLPLDQVIIYTVDRPTVSYAADVQKHVLDRFSLRLSQKLPIVYRHLHQHAHLLEPAGTFSLLMESLGAMRLAYLALNNSADDDCVLPDVFIDTTGCAFTYLPATLLFRCRVLAYVHYPTISTDMLQLVWERRRSAYNHAAYISASAITTYAKLLYYTAFAVLYGAVGSLATVVLVNSTWTYNHIHSLWKGAAWRNRIRIVFPPCSLAMTPVESVSSSTDRTNQKDQQNQNGRLPVVVSIGQFRPEKDHVLQIESMAKLIEQHPELNAKLVLIGSCRGASDEARLEQLRSLCTRYKLSDKHVEFVVNRPFGIVLEWLQKGSVGIHTMWNEHFGIGIVEMMAAGLIVIAHNSGGPKSDIVVPLNRQKKSQGESSSFSTTSFSDTTGFLASSADEYAAMMHRALALSPTEASAIRKNAQESAKRFTDEVFAESFERSIMDLLWSC